MYVQPKKITSPISGQTMIPKIQTREDRTKIYTEAVWIDPASGQFVRKGIVNIKDKETGKVEGFDI